MSAKKNLGNQYADSLARLERLERKLSRAFNAWQAQKVAIKRLEKRMDRPELNDVSVTQFTDDPLAVRL